VIDDHVDVIGFHASPLSPEPVANCGNHVLEDGEECDDGNAVAQDGCSPACRNEYCGDGIVQTLLGEVCEGHRSYTCQTPVGYNGTTRCTGCDYSPCAPTEWCGDGIVQAAAGEQCDGAQVSDCTIDGYGGTRSCQACAWGACVAREFCGDGIVQTAAGEQCDGGNMNGLTCGQAGFYGGNLSCSSTCQPVTTSCTTAPSECTPGPNPWVDHATPPVGGAPLLTDYYDGSGAVYHPGLDKIVFIRQQGWSIMDRDGSNQKHLQTCTYHDIEAVTVADPQSHHVFIASEAENKIIELDLDVLMAIGSPTWPTDCTDEGKLREFTLTDLPRSGSLGFEGLTFIPIEGHPEGGVFYAATQYCSLIAPCIYIYDIPIKTGTGDGSYTSIGTLNLLMNETAELYYDKKQDILYAVTDNAGDFIRRRRPDGSIIVSLPLDLPVPESAGGYSGTEGMTIAGCQMYITEDETGKVLRYPFQTAGTCWDGIQDQDERCTDVGEICGNFTWGRETSCNDSLDNDCDGLIDGADQDCW
jgi:cysteine-rich repeat protein